jgi:hypothetical protein
MTPDDHNSADKTLRIGDRLVCFCDGCVKAADERNARWRRATHSIPCGYPFRGLGVGR